MRAVLLLFLLIGSAALWAAGLRLFVRAPTTTRRKLVWSGFLGAIGVLVGIILPSHDVLSKFLWVMAALPLIAVADVFLLRSTRGVTYWIRACGFEVVTVFAVAMVSRYALDALSVRAVVERFVE